MTVEIMWVSNNGQRWTNRYRNIKSMKHSEDGKRISLIHEGGTETLLFTYWMLSVSEV